MKKEKTISKAQLIILLEMLFKEKTVKLALKNFPENPNYGKEEFYAITLSIVDAYLDFVITNKSIFK